MRLRVDPVPGAPMIVRKQPKGTDLFVRRDAQTCTDAGYNLPVAD